MCTTCVEFFNGIFSFRLISHADAATATRQGKLCGWTKARCARMHLQALHVSCHGSLGGLRGFCHYNASLCQLHGVRRDCRCGWVREKICECAIFVFECSVCVLCVCVCARAVLASYNDEHWMKQAPGSVNQGHSATTDEAAKILLNVQQGKR